MASRVTIERLLRDDDDASGQTIRDWKIEVEASCITIRMKHGSGFLIMRPSDIDVFAADLARAKDTARSLAAETDT